MEPLLTKELLPFVQAAAEVIDSKIRLGQPIAGPSSYCLYPVTLNGIRCFPDFGFFLDDVPRTSLTELRDFFETQFRSYRSSIA